MSIRIPTTDVQPDSKQPRTYFRESALRSLATSIKKTGQRQPITVRTRWAGAKPPYEIIDGERRWRACKLAGITTIRVDIEERDLARHADQHMLSLASNFMREGHTHIEISAAVQYQVEAAVEAGMTRGQAVKELVDSIGKCTSTCSCSSCAPSCRTSSTRTSRTTSACVLPRPSCWRRCRRRRR